MKPSGKPWTLSSILLALAGTTLVVAGLYFVLLRPPLLPEDVRYMGSVGGRSSTRSGRAWRRG